MSVSVLSNNLPQRRLAVETAVLEAIGNPEGDWTVQIHEPQLDPGWWITIKGLGGLRWRRRFFGPDEQDWDCSFIKATIREVFGAASQN